jgi:hypothetical protein
MHLYTVTLAGWGVLPPKNRSCGHTPVTARAIPDETSPPRATINGIPLILVAAVTGICRPWRCRWCCRRHVRPLVLPSQEVADWLRALLVPPRRIERTPNLNSGPTADAGVLKPGRNHYSRIGMVTNRLISMSRPSGQPPACRVGQEAP